MLSFVFCRGAFLCASVKKMNFVPKLRTAKGSPYTKRRKITNL